MLFLCAKQRKQDNDGTIVPPRPTDSFRNSITTASLVASIINGKYNNALPLDYQSRAYICNGINLATNTITNWVIKSTDNFLPLVYDRLHQLIYKNHIIHADKTPTKVMRIDNSKVKKSLIDNFQIYISISSGPAEMHGFALRQYSQLRAYDCIFVHYFHRSIL
ncbi:MAG: transposase [Lachnospiraceae bacterium]